MNYRIALVLVSLVAISACGAPVTHASDCLYLPKETKSNPYPEIEQQADCGAVSGDSLTLNPHHLKKVQYRENGLAVVVIEGKTFFVDKTGETVRTYHYDNGADEFIGGLARGIANGKTGFINSSLVFEIDPKFDFAFPFERGFAIVCNTCKVTPTPDGEHETIEGGYWGVINSQGEVVVPLTHRKDELKGSPAYLRLSDDGADL